MRPPELVRQPRLRIRDDARRHPFGGGRQQYIKIRKNVQSACQMR
jgi:hypothetical protein